MQKEFIQSKDTPIHAWNTSLQEMFEEKKIAATILTTRKLSYGSKTETIQSKPSTSTTSVRLQKASIQLFGVFILSSKYLTSPFFNNKRHFYRNEKM